METAHVCHLPPGAGGIVSLLSKQHFEDVWVDDTLLTECLTHGWRGEREGEGRERRAGGRERGLKGRRNITILLNHKTLESSSRSECLTLHGDVIVCGAHASSGEDKVVGSCKPAHLLHNLPPAV